MMARSTAAMTALVVALKERRAPRMTTRRQAQFGDVLDRFELERRERASMRWHCADGSLLGR
jgi:hypothetical protein